MKFTDGYWMTRPGVSLLKPVGVDEVVAGDGTLTVYAASARLTKRGDTLNRPLITITLDSPAEGVLGVTVEHFRGANDPGPHFELSGSDGPVAKVDTPAGGPATLTTGNLTAARRPRRGHTRSTRITCATRLYGSSRTHGWPSQA